jgi:AraC-like DNA-binding protein
MVQRIGTPQAQQHAPIPFAHCSAVLPFIRYLDQEGAPTDRWLAEAHMPTVQSNGAGGFVPLATGYQFLQNAVKQGGYDDLGVATAQQTSVFELGALGEALSQASTVFEYLQLGVKLSTTLCSGGTQFWLRREGGRLRVYQHVSGPDVLGARVAEVYTLIITINTLRKMLGPTWRPTELRLRTGLEYLLGSWLNDSSLTVYTDQANTSLTLPCCLLNHPATANVSAVSNNTPLESRSETVMPQSFLASMKYLIELLIGEGRADIKNAAEAAGISPRTLQRRLAHAGTSYRSLLLSANLRVAKQRLSDSSMRVTDIAAELGYTDASNFARAFQTQIGMSPSKYRATQRP